MSIVLAYIPSPVGIAALHHAVAEADLRNEDIVVVNVTRGDAYVDPRFAQGADLDFVKEELTKLGARFTIRQDVGDDAIHAVISVIDEVEASLLVIGMRRRTPVGKLLMGSTAQRLLLQAPCPVLAVKADDD